MNSERREFLGTAGLAGAVALGVAAGAVRAEEAGGPAAAARKVRIVGINCSARKGKTTFAALQVALEAAKAHSPDIETDIVELADLRIDGRHAVVPPKEGEQDDFEGLATKLSDRSVGGIIVGSPVYFSGMSSLCKAFLDRCMVFRKNNFALANKVAGALAVGGARNGGQELTIQGIHAALLCQEMIVVGDGRPSAHQGATLVNTKDDISGDEFGLGTAKNLGRRVAEVALKVHGA